MIHGIMNVYKEKGYTSHDVVAKLRGIVGQKKIGHTGTLDPDAEGVLPVCFGKATRLCDMLTDKDKTYETVMLLGKETDTQDITGAVLKEADTSELTKETVSECIRSFQGSYEQIPPMYSAIKVNGKKLYELAREGKEIERKPRNVTIHEIDIKEINLPRAVMEVSCSKGTYIRTLCHDIGQKLGCGACMEQLVRTKSGTFDIKDSKRLKEIEIYRDEERLPELLIPIDSMFAGLRKVVLNREGEISAHNGNPFGRTKTLSDDLPKDNEQVRVYGQDGHFIGIFQYVSVTETFRIVKMFYDNTQK